ncbi:MAG: hypothetical protein ABIP44_06530 [Pseudoxanthomonas sp.]
MNESSRVHEHLRALPDPDLPAVVWERLELARRQRMRRRKTGGVLATLAIVSIMAVPLLSRMQVTPGPDHVAQQQVAQQHAAQKLVHSAPPSGQDVHEQLRALDHALQVAYDRGASDAEIAPMWVARNELLADTRLRQKNANDNRT